jgi:DNA-binding winged helix-turn-helix (wHTH) protein/tetratricopeptide (TPR) repeat protein
VRYRFGNIELDAAAYTLRRSGRELSLQPKVFDVLLYLLEHRGRVVSKDELLEAVWRGEHVNESAVPWSISHARDALGQRRGSKKPIETVHGRGYRFAATVEMVAPSLPPPTGAWPGSSGIAKSPTRGRPFVGRAEVMRRLQARLDDAMQGRGRLCLLYGEAGIGKTRCGEELIAHATTLGFSAWVGRSVEDAGAPVFWPWIQILREAVRSRPDMREAAELLLSRLAALDPGSAASTEGGPERDELARRFWLLDEVTRLLLVSAQSAPIVLLIDDLQWADVGTLSLLAFLAPELSNARMLVVATQREEAARDGQRHLAQVARHAERIALTRLTAEDVGRYIAQLTAAQDTPAPLSAAVHRATTGNPLFVQETVRALIAEHGETALHSLAPTAVKPPEVARDVLRTRLHGVAPDTRTLLVRASVLGERFELPLLQTLSGLPLSPLLALIEAATQHELIVAETPQRYRFSHALIRALLYDEIATAERVTLHRQAGEALEALSSAEPRHSEIAHHFYRSLPAGAYDRVVTTARRAAAAADAVLAYEDALVFYEWALEAQALDPAVGPRSRAELLLACGQAMRLAGRDGAARHTLARLFELARQHGYVDLLLRGARVLRPTVAMSSVPDPLVRNALEEVLRISNDGPNAQRILALSQLACVPPYANDMQRSKQLSERALELARSLGEPSSLYAALRSRLYALSGPDDTDALLTVAAEILERERERPTVTSIEAHTARLGALLYRGESAAAEQALEAVGQVAHQFRLPEGIWYYDRQKAQQRFLTGDFAAAQTACAELRSRSTRMGLGYGPWFIDSLFFLLSVEQRGLQAVVANLDLSVVAADAPNLLPNIRASRVRGAAELGRRESAQAGLNALAAQDFEDIPKEIGYLNTLSNIAVAVVELGDLERAERIYALLAPYPRHSTPDALLLDQGSVSHYLALLAAMLGREERVEAHFEEALAMNRRMNRRPQVARTSYDYARWLAGRKQAKANARAQELGREACTMAEALGMRWLVLCARPLAG